MMMPDAEIRWAPAIVTGAVALLGWAVNWGTMREKLKDHDTHLKEHGEKIVEHETRISWLEGGGGGAD